MDYNFNGKAALVTGAASGIGLATARGFAREGAAVILADINVEGGEAAAAAIAAEGGTAAFVACDVSDEAQVEAVVAAAVERYGRLDCAFNNAGIEQGGVPITEQERETWDRYLAINLTGVMLCMKHEVRQMNRQGSGAIVNASSILGVVGAPGTHAYVATKAAVANITRSVALEQIANGIRVNATCPAAIDTPMNERTMQSVPREFLENMQPIGRMGTADEVANAVLWLCSDAASYVTGHTLYLDGGFLAQ